jgi:hypothetical protein
MNKVMKDNVSVPRHLKCLRLKGKQPDALFYVLSRTNTKPQWRFNPVELASVLKISRQGAWKMCLAFVKKGILVDIGNKRIDIPAKLQRNGWSYYIVHQFTAHLDLLYNNDGLPTNILNGTKYPKHIPPTFYNLAPKERREVLCQWIRAGRRDLWNEYLQETERDIKIEQAIIDEWVEKVHKEWETEREIAQYESIPDTELDVLKKQFRQRHCFNDCYGVNEYNGLRTCPIKIYGKATI